MRATLFANGKKLLATKRIRQDFGSLACRIEGPGGTTLSLVMDSRRNYGILIQEREAGGSKTYRRTIFESPTGPPSRIDEVLDALESGKLQTTVVERKQKGVGKTCFKCGGKEKIRNIGGEVLCTDCIRNLLQVNK